MSEISVNSILDASGGATTTINGFTPTVSNMAGRNKIINGGMGIDQRNAGAAVSTNGAFPLDRWTLSKDGGTIAASRSTVFPAGFTNSLLFSVTTGYTPTAAQQNNVRQNTEGFNVSDFGWGAAGAQSVVLSFWVRSSLTGTFAGSVNNSAYNRSYVYTYSVSAANIWEYKTVIIAGDTSGTWLTDNSVGLRVIFDLGSGSDYNATAGVWSAGEKRNTAGAVQPITTSGATFYITGVQLEEGSVATPFEHRQYGQELALCQRYFQTNYTDGVAIGTITQTNAIGRWIDAAGNYAGILVNFAVRMRAVPSVVHWGVLAGATTGQVSGDGTNKAALVSHSGQWGVTISTNNVASGSGESVRCNYTASSEL